MKSLLKILSKINFNKLHLDKLPLKKSYILTFVTVLIFIISLVALFQKFFTNNKANISNALASGQRVEVAIKTGEITGKLLKTPDYKTPKELEKEAKNKAAKEKDENEKFAWIKQDFIGPRMSEETIKTLSDAQTVAIQDDNGEAISIKDISEKPLVIIIIKGVGLSSSTTSEALELPKEVAMGFSPYSPTLEQWTKKSKDIGHENILNIPMETDDYRTNNPGPYSILTQSSEEDNLTRLKMLLGLTKDYIAIYSDNNEVFTRSEASITPILNELKKEHKAFIYGGGYANYSLIQVADGLKYPILVNDMVLDDEISTDQINDKLKQLEKIAKDKGYAVAMAHPYPITVRMLKSWLQTIDEKGIVLKPISTILGKKIK